MDVRSALAAGLPDLRADSVDLIGEGVDHFAYEINNDLIVRMSKDPDPAQTDREARLLTLVAEVSPVPVPTPVFVLAEQGCLAYRKLAGTPLLDLAVPVHPAALTGLLAALHAVPAARVEGLVEVDDLPLAEWLREAVATYPAVAGDLPAPFRGRVETFLDTAPPADGDTLVFSHNDLGIEHVLVDAAGEVTGVIDWSDAALVDPACDLGRLFRDLGPAALPGDPSLRDRAVFYARCGVLEDLAYGLEAGRIRYVEKSLRALGWLF
ncbi:phosphotransferase family protein [Actinoplanes awajinensis]|uniref:phosphotransferase family protein n=1 Tax=Actinoplanes awajinensis TaxID=135946 RepID=UPI0018DD6D34|nr:phosphotransferase [Actinoplanes awajinensis]